MIKLIKNGTVITMDESRKAKYEKLDIVIKDDTIIELSNSYKGSYDELVDATDKYVLPGLINCHAHLGMSPFRCINDNYDLDTWLNKKIWPIEQKFTNKDVYHCTLQSCIEMIKTGTTTCNDMYFFHEGIYDALKKSKIRNVFPLYFIGDLDDSNKEKLKTLEDFYLTHKSEELFNFAVAPHSLYTTSIKLIKELKSFADKYALPIHMHYCENKNEIKQIESICNGKPYNILEECKILDNKLILAHCTFIPQEDQLKFKKENVSFVHNPISNLNLGCGIADITSYIKNGINVCLGTDGQGSGNSMNMFYHMSFVDFLQKGKYEDPTVFSSYETLKMATINGAKALGLEEKIGSITVGKKADIVILNLNKGISFPTIDPITQIVHDIETTNIETTIINGEVVMKNHKLLLNIDEEKLRKEIKNLIKEKF